ncbi:hypothetical protein WN51_06693 [Melipona quadrifasciata]|uniref:Uncharacterized protein n=1 Tax=Melipona quadrifasciata TaxID=166423 RepID=A0A0N0BKC5_9HYME|nr:hypothetical protein WN51_06693 [Melipona quadrifasciata]
MKLQIAEDCPLQRFVGVHGPFRTVAETIDELLGGRNSRGCSSDEQTLCEYERKRFLSFV